MNISIRRYAHADKLAVDQVVLDAWIELAPVTPEWDQLAPRLTALTEHASYTEIAVAELGGDIVGAVGYVGPYRPKPEFFAPEWPMIRFLSVVPKARGNGLGQALLNECIRCAKRDNTELIALHTTPVMEAAQQLYRRAGFEVVRHLPDMYGVPYVLMTKELQRD